MKQVLATLSSPLPTEAKSTLGRDSLTYCWR